MVGVGDLLDDDVDVDVLAAALDGGDGGEEEDEGEGEDGDGDGAAGPAAGVQRRKKNPKRVPVEKAVLDLMLFVFWDVEVYDNDTHRGGCCSIGAVAATGGSPPTEDVHSADWFHEYVWPKPAALDSRKVAWNPFCFEKHKIERQTAFQNGKTFLDRWGEMVGWMQGRREAHASLKGCSVEDVEVCLVAHNGESCDFTWLWRELHSRPDPADRVKPPTWCKHYWDTLKMVGEYKGTNPANPFYKKGDWDGGLGMEALAAHYGLDTEKCHSANWDSFFNCIVAFKPEVFQHRNKAKGIGLLKDLWGRKQAKLDKVMQAIGHAVRDDWEEEPDWLRKDPGRPLPKAPDKATGPASGPTNWLDDCPRPADVTRKLLGGIEFAAKVAAESNHQAFEVPVKKAPKGRGVFPCAADDPKKTTRMRGEDKHRYRFDAWSVLTTIGILFQCGTTTPVRVVSTILLLIKSYCRPHTCQICT
jgi:hypothetical protein